MTIKNLERKLTKVEEEIRWMKKKIAKLELVAKDIRAEIKVKTSPALTVVSSIKKSKRSNAMLVEKKFIENLSSTPKRRRSSRLSITYPDVSDIPKEPNSTIENNFQDQSAQSDGPNRKKQRRNLSVSDKQQYTASTCSPNFKPFFAELSLRKAKYSKSKLSEKSSCPACKQAIGNFQVHFFKEPQTCLIKNRPYLTHCRYQFYLKHRRPGATEKKAILFPQFSLQDSSKFLNLCTHCDFSNLYYNLSHLVTHIAQHGHTGFSASFCT